MKHRTILPLRFILLSCMLVYLPNHPIAAEAPPTDAEESDLALLPQPSPEREETLRNQAIAAQLALTDKETEANWLGTGKDQFLALYLPDKSGNPFLNALILHDNLQNPDWPGSVRSLRTVLPKGGINTLSVAVPDYQPKPVIPALETSDDRTNEDNAEPALDTEATEPPGINTTDESSRKQTAIAAEDVPRELAQRIDLASNFLNNQSPFPLIIIAVGSSATLMLQQVKQDALNGINGLVIVDPLPLTDLEGVDLEMKDLNLRLPLLDIAPEFNPRSDPKIRATNARREHQNQYQQRILRGVSREFRGSEMRLVKAVRGWAEANYRAK